MLCYVLLFSVLQGFPLSLHMTQRTQEAVVGEGGVKDLRKGTRALQLPSPTEDHRKTMAES